MSLQFVGDNVADAAEECRISSTVYGLVGEFEPWSAATIICAWKSNQRLDILFIDLNRMNSLVFFRFVLSPQFSNRAIPFYCNAKQNVMHQIGKLHINIILVYSYANVMARFILNL